MHLWTRWVGLDVSPFTLQGGGIWNEPRSDGIRMKIIYSYIELTDTYYFHHKGIYITRAQFAVLPVDYLASMLGIEDIPLDALVKAFNKLSQKPAQAHTDTLDYL